jgi:RNA polymerase sigma-70 factor, ECF subfamily
LPTTVAALPRSYRPRLTIHESTDAERERDLIDRARQGDREAFGALVRAHLAPAIRLAMQVVRNEADAEDVVQDAFLSALRNIDDFEPGRPFRPWLSRIVINRAIDLVSSRANRSNEALVDTHPSGDVPATELVEGSELVAHVRRVLSTMPPRQRLIVELFDLQGASVAEIAALTGSAAATVRWHLHIGRRTLRKALSHLYGDTNESK